MIRATLPAVNLPTRPEARRLLVGTFLSSIGQGMTLPFLFVYLTEVRHLDPTIVGVVAAWMGLLGLILSGPTGALMIGDPETVVTKILYVNEVLGGLSRITFQMGVSALPHEKMLRSIEVLGTRVGPIVRRQLTTVLS